MALGESPQPPRLRMRKMTRFQHAKPALVAPFVVIFRNEIFCRCIPQAPDGDVQTQWSFAAGMEFSVRNCTQSPSGAPPGFEHAAFASPRAKFNTVHLQGNMVGQTISLCRLPGSGRDRPRRAMVCFDE